MTTLAVIGISHKTSPVELREKFYLRIAERELLLNALRNDPAVVEAMVLSTCNRTEIYAQVISADPSVLRDHLFRVKHIPETSDLRQYFYAYTGSSAVSHLLRVACGLDSVVLGETQILGQVKSAVELSRQSRIMGPVLNLLSRLAIRAGKKAQTETQVGCGGSSVSWAAVTAAEQNFGSLQGKSVLIIGAGKMGELAAAQLKNKGVQDIYIINRSRDKAEALAKECGAFAASFWDIKNLLYKVDVCICSAGAPHYLIEKDLVEQVMEKRSQKLLFVDISIPRNIDPEILLVAGTELISIDDLDQVVEGNVRRRYAAVADVEKIIAGKVSEFYDKLTKARLAQASSRDEVLSGESLYVAD